MHVRRANKRGKNKAYISCESCKLDRVFEHLESGLPGPALFLSDFVNKFGSLSIAIWLLTRVVNLRSDTILCRTLLGSCSIVSSFESFL